MVSTCTRWGQTIPEFLWSRFCFLWIKMSCWKTRDVLNICGHSWCFAPGSKWGESFNCLRFRNINLRHHELRCPAGFIFTHEWFKSRIIAWNICTLNYYLWWAPICLFTPGRYQILHRSIFSHHSYSRAVIGYRWVMVPGVEYGLIVIFQLVGCFISVIPVECWNGRNQWAAENMDVYLVKILQICSSSIMSSANQNLNWGFFDPCWHRRNEKLNPTNMYLSHLMADFTAFVLSACNYQNIETWYLVTQNPKHAVV